MQRYRLGAAAQNSELRSSRGFNGREAGDRSLKRDRPAVTRLIDTCRNRRGNRQQIFLRVTNITYVYMTVRSLGDLAGHLARTQHDSRAHPPRATNQPPKPWRFSRGRKPAPAVEGGKRQRRKNGRVAAKPAAEVKRLVSPRRIRARERDPRDMNPVSWRGARGALLRSLVMFGTEGAGAGVVTGTVGAGRVAYQRDRERQLLDHTPVVCLPSLPPSPSRPPRRKEEWRAERRGRAGLPSRAAALDIKTPYMSSGAVNVLRAPPTA